MLILKKISLRNFISVGDVPLLVDLSNYNRTLVLGYNGTGKEQPISEPVLTPTGWSTMGQLRPGDYVIGSSGLPIKVLSIHPQGVKDVYTVHTMDGVQIRCGQDHLWSVLVQHHGVDVLKIHTTQELIDKGVRRLNGNTKYKLPKFEGLQQGKYIDYAYTLGYCLGNGGFSQSLLTVSYDSRIEYKLLPLLESTLGLPTNIRINGGFSGQSAYSWSKIHPEIAKYRNSGLSYDKHLHKDHTDWLLWDYNSRLELLRGLLDSDGTTGLSKADGRQRSSFCSTSINLLVLVRDLVRSLGGRTGEPNQENRTYYKSGYCASLAFRMPLCPFILKSDVYRPSRRSMQSTISSITKDDYQEEQVCITVDADDQLYVTTGFKLTHNSSTLLDSITYALYGTAYRNINKNQLINSINKSDLVVEIEFTIGTDNYKVVRGLQPAIFEIYHNDIKLNELPSIKEQQRFLEEQILKINYLTFSNIAILGSSGYIPFMDQPLATRRSLVEELLDINLFAQMSAVAKDSSRELGDELKSLLHEIKSIKSQITLVDNFITSILNYKPVDNTDEINKLREKLKEYEQKISEIRINKSTLNEELLGLVDPSVDIDTIKRALIELKSTVKSEQKTVSFYEKNDTCPTCTQIIDLELKKQSLDISTDKISKILDRINKGDILLHKKTDLSNTIKQIESSISALERDYRDINRDIANIEIQLDKLITPIVRENKDLSEYQSQLLVFNQQLSTLYDKLESTKLTKANYDIVVKILSDSGIKSKILEKYLPYFNSYINNYLNIFGLSINFEFNNLFKEVIRSRFREGYSYDSFSEGEKMKISLSIMLAFRDLASLKSTNSTNILIMDEIFDSSLDSDSNQNLMSILSGMVDNNIFIISHRNDINADDFERTMTFSKFKDFTRVKYT